MYDPLAAVTYAKTYAYDYNPDFPDYSQASRSADCTNFISQCLFAGGKVMQGNDSYNYLDNWFCYSDYLWDTHLISSSWRGVSPFIAYWNNHAKEYRDFTRAALTQFEQNVDLLKYVSLGDPLVLIRETNIPYHMLLIVGFEEGNILCAAHTIDTDATPLRNYNPAKFRVYKV